MSRLRINSYCGGAVAVACEPRWAVNSVAVDCGTGYLVIDTLGSPLAGRQARQAFDRHFGSPLRAVINTHHHYDHVLGNQAFADVPCYAHERVPAWMDSYDQRLRSEVEGKPAFRDFKLIRPDSLISRTATVAIESLQCELQVPGPCHTDNDLLISIPALNLIVTADIHVPFTVIPVNPRSGGDPWNWIQTLSSIQAQQPEPLIIPGHFSEAGAASVKRHKDYLESLTAIVMRNLDVSGSSNAWLDIAEQEMIEFADMRNYRRYNRRNLEAAMDIARQRRIVSPEETDGNTR